MTASQVDKQPQAMIISARNKYNRYLIPSDDLATACNLLQQDLNPQERELNEMS